MPPPDPALLSLNQITTKRWSLAQSIEGCQRHGVRGISIWRDKLAEMGLAKAAAAVKAAGLAVTGVCRGGMFTHATAAERAAKLDDNLKAIDEAHALGAQCLIMVVGGLPPGSKDIAGAREQVQEGLAAILGRAREARVPIAIEPLHPMQAADRACVNTLDHALDICDALDPARSGAIGVAVDVYHVWWDPNLARAIRRAGKPRLLAYHICDWLVPTTDTAFDRGMMGDGVIDLPGIRGWMQDAGYAGMHEVEIFSSRDWWERDPDEVLRTCRERHAAT
jgi:sugar phosphate isomerase/epimerase